MSVLNVTGKKLSQNTEKKIIAITKSLNMKNDIYLNNK